MPPSLRTVLVGALLLSAVVPVAAQDAAVLTADQLHEEMARKDILLLDARNLKLYEKGHIQGAKMPRPVQYFQQEELFRQGLSAQAPDQEAALVEWTKDLPKETPIVTYCNANCPASAVLATRLKQLGFLNVRSMEEGYQVWEQKGYPVSNPDV